MQKKVWVVVSNGSLTKIFEAKNENQLIEIKHFEHVESRIAGHDLVTDRQGKQNVSWTSGSHGFEPRVLPKEKELGIFAKEVAEYLEQECLKGSFDTLYLISSPTFLGLLRSHFGPHALKKVKQELHKDFTHIDPRLIRDQLPFVL